MAKNMTNEFVIAYIDQFDDHLPILKNSCKYWNNIAKNQLRRKIKYLEHVLENERKKTRNFDVAFQNGSKAYFLFIPRDISVFDLHTELRESFLEGIKEHYHMSFNLLNISEQHQRILISALSSLSLLSQWKYPSYGRKSKKQKANKEKKEFGFYSTLDQEEVNGLISDGEFMAEGTNLARTLASTPTNYMKSKDLMLAAKKISQKHRDIRFEFINEKKLKEMSAGCFLSVIQGTDGSDGGIAHLSYIAKGKNENKTIALIGKGVVFDTGGYNIKTDGSMKDMHRDMTGAAIALSVFQALVKKKVKVNIDLYLAIGENLLSEKAYKPNDVVIAMDGTSVEINDTDAEGRMLLADTFIYAKKNNPDLIIDFATLTGDAIGAVDSRYSCVFSNDYDLGLKAVDVGMKCGERVWNFPTTEDYCEMLSSDIADIMQCQHGSNAEQIYAACFLQYFAGNNKWIHVDLSSEYHENGLGLVDTNVTGFGVRWCFDFINRILEEWNE